MNVQQHVPKRWVVLDCMVQIVDLILRSYDLLELICDDCHMHLLENVIETQCLKNN